MSVSYSLMNLDLINLEMYSAQLALLVIAAALLAWILRLRAPEARLAHWQAVLLVALLLPFAEPLREASTDGGNVRIVTGAVTPLSIPSASAFRLPLAETILAIIVAGAALRIAWFALGLWKLRGLRRRGRVFDSRPAWLDALERQVGARAEFLISSEVDGPVTFGARRPVILLPARFAEMPSSQQQALCCHELFHVRRHDWVFTAIEELARAVFWFHPAMWWLLGELQLAREQTVDAQVVDLTKARQEYLEALLVVAAAQSRLDLAPAPLFLRRRHLAERVACILREVRMSTRQRLFSFAASSGLAVVTAIAAAWWLPMRAPAQQESMRALSDDIISIDTGNAKLLHRDLIDYPLAARQKGIEGTVFAEVALDAKGNVIEARIISGPEELRSTVLTSIVRWHFQNDAGLARLPVSVTFKLPAPRKDSRPRIPAPDGPLAEPGTVLARIKVIGELSDTAREELTRRLPIRVGDRITAGLLERIKDTVNEIDEHLLVGISLDQEGKAILTIGAAQRIPSGGMPPPPPPPPLPDDRPSAAGEGRIRVGGNAQSAKLIQKTTPAYPPLAKQARIQGTVRFNVIIGKDGTVQNISLVSGHPLLVPAATEAIREWVYQPTLLNGNPVEVVTMVDVNFTLSE